MFRTDLLMIPLVTVVAAVALSGCVGESPVSRTVPSTSPRASSAFASDAAVLAAATAAYKNYIAVSDEVGNGGGRDVERVKDLVTAKYFPEQQKDFSDLFASGRRIGGFTTVQQPTLQSSRPSPSGATRATLYVCLDVTTGRLLAADGSDITPPDRPEFYPLVVEMTTLSPTSSAFLLDSSDSWKGKNFCAQP